MRACLDTTKRKMNHLACNKSSHIAALCQLSRIMCNELSCGIFAEVIMSAASVRSADAISLCMIYQPLVYLQRLQLVAA